MPDPHDARKELARLIAGKDADFCVYGGGALTADGGGSYCQVRLWETKLPLADRILAAGWTPPASASGAQQAGDVREGALAPGWFRLHPYRTATSHGCASEGCLGHPQYRLEVVGVGSDYCGNCAAKIGAFRALPAPEVTEEMVLAAAKRMAFAGRHPNDVSRDAEHFWQCHTEEARARYLAMATAAIRAALDTGDA